MYRMILIPLITAAFFIMLNCFSWKPKKPAPAKARQKSSGKKQRRADAKPAEQPEKLPNVFTPLLPAAAEIAFFLVYRLLHHLFMAGEDYLLPKSVILLICVVVDFTVFLHMWFRGTKLMQLIGRLAILAAFLFVAEFVLFNAKSFATEYREEYVGSEYLIIHDDDTTTERSGDHIRIRENTAIDVTELPGWCKAITLNAVQEENHRPFYVKLLMHDDNFQQTYCPVSAKLTSTYGRPVDFMLHTYGELYDVQIEFRDMDTPVDFYGLTCSNKIPFHFNAFRFFSLFILIGLLITVLQLRLHRIVYNPASKKHAAAFLAVSILCTCSAFFLWIPDQEPVSYPENFNAAGANPYEQMFDAFENGRLPIDVELDPNLAALGENLYDRSVRDSLEINYAWDRAYYQGELYSYFGTAPVFTFYYPYYWIKGGLPTLAQVNFFFAILSIPFLCLTLLAIVKRYCPKANLLLLLLMLPTATILSGDQYFLQFPNQYNVVVASGLCFLMISLWLGFMALDCKKPAVKLILLVFCGIFCVLSTASRPSIVLGELILAPAFLNILRDKTQKLPFRLGQAACFLIPVGIGAGCIMAYNNARFSSPFDFGESYQLTVSNIQANKLYLNALPGAIYHYFLQPCAAKNVFPFFTFSIINLDNYGMFKYYEIGYGLFNFPVLPLGCILLPLYLRRRKALGKPAVSGEAKAFVLCCLVISVLLAWIEFSKGGVSIRYQMDFMHLMVFLSVIVVLTLIRKPGRFGYPLAVGAILVSIAEKLLMMLHITREGLVMTTLITVHPTYQEILEDALIFWD